MIQKLLPISRWLSRRLHHYNRSSFPLTWPPELKIASELNPTFSPPSFVCALCPSPEGCIQTLKLKVSYAAWSADGVLAMVFSVFMVKA